MNPLHTTLLLVAFAGLADGAAAQTTYFSEDFDAGMPAGFTLTNNNGSTAFGWVGESTNFFSPGVEHEDESGVGQADDDMDTSDFDLSGATAAYIHFQSIVYWANYQANHPSTLGNGVSSIEVSTDSGTTWSSGLWVDTQTASGSVIDEVIDVSTYVGSATTRLRFHYEGDFAHNWGIDNLTVDDDPNIPPPAPVMWTHMNLPTSFVDVTGGYTEDFETGTVQANMAITIYDPVTGTEPDPDGWCNVGQQGPMAGTPFGGSYSLEMALVPGTTNYHNVQNSMILGLNGGGQAVHSLDVMSIDLSDELNNFDGIWVSEDGSGWYQLFDGQGALAWTAQSFADLGLGGLVDVSGDFYLMFSQEDNFPYNGADGIGFDDIVIDGGSGGPSLALVGTCGVAGSGLSGAGMTPGGLVGLGFGFGLGGFTLVGGACNGTVVDILNPVLLGLTTADGAGMVSLLPVNGIPAGACGAVHCQAMDVTTCATSNVVSL